MAKMSLPYEKASSGDRAVADMQKILRSFGCNKFGTMLDYDSGELLVQFEHHGRQVCLKASYKGYAAAWLKHHPWGPRSRRTRGEHEQRALEVGSIAVYSVVRDWIKGQTTAIEIGMMSFEGAFLSHLLLKNGQTVIDVVRGQGLLPAAEDSSTTEVL